MALSTEDAATLASLKTARDKLASGSKVESVTNGDTSVHYTAGDMAMLQRRIDELEAQNSTSGRRRGAVRFRVC